MFGLFPTIGGFAFLILLLATYYTKQRFKTIQNKLFRYMLAFSAVLAVTDILAYLALRFLDNNFLIILMYKVDWFVGFFWFVLLYYYAYAFVKNIEANSIEDLIAKSKHLRIMSFVFVICFITYLLVPVVGLDKTNITWLPKYISYYVYIFCIFVVLSILTLVTLNAKITTARKKITVWIMIIELTILLVLQFIFPYISFAPFAEMLQLFFLYFNIENPDLKIIEEVETLKEEAENSNKAKTDFLSNMSHEIRSPMNAIIGFSESLSNVSDFDEKSVRRDINHISLAGNNLLDIINNILDISKIESGKDELVLKEYSFANIILELSSIIEARIGDNQIKLILDVDESIPKKLYGDQLKIYQILLNILTNSVKYTEVGKIKVSIRNEIVGDVCKLHIKISDTGTGIKKEDYNKMFEKFSRLDNATSKEIEGTGLGLVITQKYVDLMGGKIWFESEYQVGTSFYVDIDQKIVDKTPIGQLREPIKTEEKIHFIDCSSHSVLVVDDNQLNLKVAARILKKYNFNVDVSESGKDCIYKIKDGKKYDLIFMDHMMPEMDGIETMHILKKLDGYDIPPIIALTANALTGMKETYIKEGFEEYLSKPININELNKIINKYFNK